MSGVVRFGKDLAALCTARVLCGCLHSIVTSPSTRRTVVAHAVRPALLDEIDCAFEARVAAECWVASQQMCFQALMVLTVWSLDLLCVALPVQGACNTRPIGFRKRAHDGHDLVQLVMLEGVQWLSYFLHEHRHEARAVREQTASHASARCISGQDVATAVHHGMPGHAPYFSHRNCRDSFAQSGSRGCTAVLSMSQER